MAQAVSVTSKGQVTIPVDIREHLGITAGSKVVFERQEDVVVVKPRVDFLSLKGSVQAQAKVSDEKADEMVAQFMAKEYGK